MLSYKNVLSIQIVQSLQSIMGVLLIVIDVWLAMSLAYSMFVTGFWAGI